MSNLKMVKVLNAFNTETNTISIDSEQLTSVMDKSLDLGASTNVYATVSNLPISAQAYSKALVTDTNTLYQYNGGWYPIALINNFNPAFIIEPNATYELNSDGSATTVTVLAQDSDDIPIVYSVITDSDFNQFATCTHDSDKHNVWTITPTVSSGEFPAGTVTFRASDGVNLANVNSEFSITFGLDWNSPTETILLASDPTRSEYLGYTSSLDDSGATLVSGSLEGDHTASNNAQGSAYVYTRTGSTWSSQAKLEHSSAAIQDEFGFSIAISGDGNYIVVGAPGNDSNGAFYVFVKSGSTWSQQARIAGSANAEWMGSSVSINYDGTYIVSGARGFQTNTGAVYVYTRSGSSWSQQQRIRASADITPTLSSGGLFGTDVTVNADATYMVASAPGAALYVFTRSGSTWSQQQRLLASNSDATDSLGGSRSTNISQTQGNGGVIDISGDGDYIIAGAKLEDDVDNLTSNCGAAYIWKRTNSTWSEEAVLRASDVTANQQFGETARISKDGNYAICGAPGAWNGAQLGAAYVFQKDGSTWTQIKKLVSSDVAINDMFGWSTDINEDGSFIAVGAYGEDGGAGDPYTNTGAVYVYEAG